MGAAYPDLLGAMQYQLSRVYDVDLSQDVRDYVVTDEKMRAVLMAGSAARLTDEQLIVMESDDGVDLALYLDRAVLERLVAADPRENLSGTNLADFWTVLEGVSHFHYFAWNATFDKSVTLLELEMQAEVDKYISTRLLLQEQPTSTLGAPLLQRLFTDPAFDPQLDLEELERYQAATALARRYCTDLESRFPIAPFTPALLRELRTFYRLPQAAKIARIRTRGLA